VALCRFGGLRCPGEVLTLKWADIDWERGRFLVHSCKTEHHAEKECRETPLFPELQAILGEAFEAAPEGSVYVVANDRYRQAADSPRGWRSCNLRTQFGRIIERAGLEPWPFLFHALRKSRETELCQDFPIHVVTAWLGNTPKIALKHYLMTTDADFAKSTAMLPKVVEKAVQNPVQAGAISGAATVRDCSQDSARNDISPCKTRAYAKLCVRLHTSAKIISGEDRTLRKPLFLPMVAPLKGLGPVRKLLKHNWLRHRHLFPPSLRLPVGNALAMHQPCTICTPREYRRRSSIPTTKPRFWQVVGR
jgi:hypothetical protein